MIWWRIVIRIWLILGPHHQGHGSTRVVCLGDWAWRHAMSSSQCGHMWHVSVILNAILCENRCSPVYVTQGPFDICIYIFFPSAICTSYSYIPCALCITCASTTWHKTVFWHSVFLCGDAHWETVCPEQTQRYSQWGRPGLLGPMSGCWVNRLLWRYGKACGESTSGGTPHEPMCHQDGALAYLSSYFPYFLGIYSCSITGLPRVMPRHPGPMNSE